MTKLSATSSIKTIIKPNEAHLTHFVFILQRGTINTNKQARTSTTAFKLAAAQEWTRPVENVENSYICLYNF